MAKSKVNLEEDDIAEELDEVEVADDIPEEPGEPVAVVAEEPAPKGANTGLTLALCGLNVVAALAFTFLLLLDFHKRQEWSYAVFLNELFMVGLPLKEEDEGPTASRATLPRQKLDSTQVADVLRQRGGKAGGEFWAVDEALPTHIRPQDLTQAILKDYFAGVGAPVAALEDEIKRLKDKVPADIAAAASEVKDALQGKDDAAKRQFAEKVLLPLAYHVYQVEALDKKINAAKGAELDTLIEDSVQRRLMIEILAPCEIYRPGDVTKFMVQKAGDLDYLKLDQIKDLLRRRFDVAVAPKFDATVHQGQDWEGQKRLSWEKRQTIGFLLVTIANVLKPDAAGQFVHLYPDTGAAAGTPNMQRAQTVLGLYEFAAAAQNLPVAWRILEQRLLEAIHADREGFEVLVKDKEGKERPERNPGFVDKYAAEVGALRNITTEIKKTEERLDDLREQNKKVKKIYEDREQHLKAMTEKLLAARKETARQVAELNVLQGQLFRAQAVLRNADQRNQQLRNEIQAEEAKAKKGAKTP